MQQRGGDTVGRNTTSLEGTPQEEYFPGILGGGAWAVLAQRQLLRPLNATHSEIAQVGSLSVSRPEELESQQ